MQEQFPTLFTSPERTAETRRLRQLLVSKGFPFCEKNLGSNPQLGASLTCRHGDIPTLPGIALGDVWIGADADDLEEELDRQFCNTLLKGSGASGTASTSHSSSDEDEINFTPSKIANGWIGRVFESGIPPTSTLSSSRTMQLPNGQDIAVGEMSRLLMEDTLYRRDRSNCRLYFRGSEGVKLWKKIPFLEKSLLQYETAVAFGQSLIEHGILHDYTPGRSNFDDKALILFAHFEPRALNTLVEWQTPPSFSSTGNHAAPVLLRLSRQMDVVCNEANFYENLSLFHELEEAVCELQTVTLPDHPFQDVPFLLNLHNLIMRHALIVSECRQWSWPSCLDELGPFLSRIGYNVGGTWFSLATIQASLLGGPQKLKTTTRGRWWKRLSCLSVSGLTHRSDDQVHYPHGTLRTDLRLAMALSWGTQSSPHVISAPSDPALLEQHLQDAARAYCSRHVLLVDDLKTKTLQVRLPALFSWYGNDFGGPKPERVLETVLPFLTETQQSRLGVTRKRTVTFSLPHNWKCGFPASVMPHTRRGGTSVRPFLPPPSIPTLALETPMQMQQQRSPNNVSRRVLRHDKLHRTTSMGDTQLVPKRETAFHAQRPDHDDADSSVASNVSDITYGSDFDICLWRSSKQLQSLLS